MKYDGNIKCENVAAWEKRDLGSGCGPWFKLCVLTKLLKLLEIQ